MKVQKSRPANGVNDYSGGAHIEFSHSLIMRYDHARENLDNSPVNTLSWEESDNV